MKNNKRRNYPPRNGIRIPAREMHRLVVDLFTRVAMPIKDAAIMADLLVQTDLRCVFSHGTLQIPGYISMIQDGKVNPQPKIRVVTESLGSLVIDGDGGMGHLACFQGTRKIIEKAKAHGTAALTTCNHFHFGSAGKYTRMALDQNCIGLSISSHRLSLKSEDIVFGSTGGSPISIAIPTGEQPPLVLDMGGIAPFSQELFEQAPSVIVKSLGMGAVTQALGGILAGIYKLEFLAGQSSWESNQGSFVAVFSVDHFFPEMEFKNEMDRYIGEAGKMSPLPGMERAVLAGGLEWQWAKENNQIGIPVSKEHQEALENIAIELGVDTPFARFEKTQF